MKQGRLALVAVSTGDQNLAPAAGVWTKEVASLSNLVDTTRSSEAGHGFVVDRPVERRTSSEVYAPRFIVEGDGFFVEWQMQNAGPKAKAS